MTEPKTELQKNAIAQARRIELDTFQRALDIQWLNSRMENGRMGRCLALIQREADMEKDFQTRTDHAAIVNAQAKQDTDLGYEIANVRREEICRLLRRHYLRENDPELRELMKKLQAGYVCRDLQQQILHNEYRRLQEKSEEQHANEVLRNALYNDNEQEERLEMETFEQKKKYCKELQQQLVNRQRERQCKYEDTLIEKKMLDDILRTISDEDKRELQQKREQTEKMRNEMVTFKKARDAWMQKQKEMVIREEIEIERQKQAASDRSAAILAERMRRLKEREETNAKIAAKVLADEAARQERDNIIMQLQEQEYLEKNVQNDIDEKEKSERVKKETKEALTEQMETKKRLENEQKQREKEFRKESEASVIENEEKERERERKKREKNKKYSIELMQQIESNAMKKKQDAIDEENRAKYVFDYARKWEAEVNNERKKIVKEHVPHLLGYLQAGVVKKEDLPNVRKGANRHEHLATLDIESMAISNRPRRFAKCNAQCQRIRRY